MVKVSVVGATGYTGEELLHLLIKHPNVRITSLSAIVEKPTNIAEIFPRFNGRLEIVCRKLDVAEVIKKSDVVFLALPHTVSMKYAAVFLRAGKKVIDLSADYRLSAADYKRWYGKSHDDTYYLKRAIYGLPELYRKDIRKCSLVANPGCYPTGVILAVAPLIKEGLANTTNIIADSKSGVTGAGRKAALSLIFGEVADNFRAYKVGTHQHTAEINRYLSILAGSKVEVLFVPHVLPVRRGILSTMYMKTKKRISQQKASDICAAFFRGEPFVRVLRNGQMPELKNVINTNFCDIGIKVVKNTVVAVSAIDNLTKGAAGQAVQNMNLMCGFGETEGLM